MMLAYRAAVEKVSFGRRASGTIRSTVVIGPDGGIVHHYPIVKDAGGHPQQVLEWLESRG